MVLNTKKIQKAVPLKLASGLRFSRGFGCSFLLAAVVSSASIGAEYSGHYFYRYINDKGEMVIATQVPREASRRGYEVITESGRVLEVVEPELSEEARLALSLQKKIEQQKQAQARQQAQVDEELLHLFASAEDVDRSLERLLEEIDARIAVIDGNIQRLQLQYEQKQSQAAVQERSGRQVSESLVQEMKDLQTGQDRLKKDVVSFEQEKDQLKADYAQRKDRVRYLLEGGEQTVSRNENLILSKGDIPGEWEPVQTGSGVISWEAEDSGRFVLIRQGDRGLEKWRGNWSLSRNNEIVVLYFRKEITKAGKISKVAFAREERYPVMDARDGDLFVYWGESVVRFHKES